MKTKTTLSALYSALRLTAAVLALLLVFEGKGWGQSTYTLINSTTDLVAGAKYLIATKDSELATVVKAMGWQNTNNRPEVDAGAISAGLTITLTPATLSTDHASAYEVTLGGSTGAWTLYDAVNASYLRATSSSNNYLQLGTTSNWTITFTGNAAVMTSLNGSFTRNILRYNSPLFSCYSSGQAAVYLYKLQSGTPPTVTTQAASSIGTTTATGNGTITAIGSSAISVSGICWNTSPNPTTSNFKTTDGPTTTTSYTGSLTGLDVNTRYYVKAYATNTAGIGYGDEVNFYTLANVPAAPTVGGATSSSLTVTVNVNSNSASTEFAIQETGGNYVQASGALGASAVWQTASAWGTKTVTGLSSSTQYTFQVKARNGENTETAFGSTASGTTAISAPTATAASMITSSSFNANWEAVTGAIGYQLDVYEETIISNLLLNPGFESGTTDSWTFQSSMNQTASTTQVHTGTYSLYTTVAATKNFSQTISVTSGVPHNLKFWYYIDNTSTGSGFRVWTTTGATIYLPTSTTYYNTKGSWQLVETTFTPSSASLEFNLRVYNGAIVYFDDFEIIESSKGTVETPIPGSPFSISGGDVVFKYVDNLTPNTAYKYRVRAVGSSSTSGNSNVIEVTTRSAKVTTQDGDWNTIIWSPVGTPTAADDVTINHAVTIGVGQTADCHNLTIGTGSLTISSSSTGTGSLIPTGSITGSVTVQRYLTGGWSVWNSGWHQISSPVAVQAISAFATGNYDFYGWRESDNLWLNYKAGDFSGWNGGTNFNVGQGYLISYQAATSTQTFTGTLNTASVTKTGLTTNGGTYNGWNLLGNPFASALVWNDGNWALSNVAGNTKIWHEANKSYSDIAANGVIPSAQGFMVQVSNASNSITIPAASRTHNPQAFYKSGNEQLLLVAAETEGGSAQESKIIVNPMATEGFDFEYDSRFLTGYAPMLYSVVGDEKLSTNSLPELSSGMVIPFGFAKNAATAFTIELKESIAGRVVYLTDIKTGVVTNLTETPVYSFTSNQGDDPARFELKFGTVGINDPATVPTINAWYNAGTLYVANKTGVTNIFVFNVQGQQVQQSLVQGNGLQTISLHLPAGVYFAQLVNSGNRQTVKIIVK